MQMQSETNWTYIYEDLNSLGIFVADLTLISMMIIGIMLVICGIYFIYVDDESQFMRLTGNVVDSVCEKNSKNIFKCTLTVDYETNGKRYTKKLYQYDKIEQYMKGEPIDLIIAKCDHSVVKVAFKKMWKWGLTLILFALIMVGVSYINYYLSHNFKIYSAAQGIFVILNLFITGQ